MARNMTIEEVLEMRIKDVGIVNLEKRIGRGPSSYSTYLELVQSSAEPVSPTSTLYFFSSRYRNRDGKILLLALPSFAVIKCTAWDDESIEISIKKRRFWRPRISLIINSRRKEVFLEEGGKAVQNFIYRAL